MIKPDHATKLTNAAAKAGVKYGAVTAGGSLVGLSVNPAKAAPDPANVVINNVVNAPAGTPTGAVDNVVDGAGDTVDMAVDIITFLLDIL
jgi:hypothetical protein